MSLREIVDKECWCVIYSGSMEHFSNSKYTQWYWTIVETRQRWPLDECVYSEEHHVIPESFFKQRSRNGPAGWLDGDPEDRSNLVRLSAREHFICHWLLVKMTTGIAHIKMRDALEMMGVDSENQKRYSTRITSRVFERNRIIVAQQRSERMMGDGNPAKRPEVGKAISESKLGVKRAPFSEEWIANMTATRQGDRNGMWGKTHSEESKEKIRASAENLAWVNNGASDLKIQKSEVEKYLREGWVRGRKYVERGSRDKKLCPHCGTLAAANTYKRWHGDNCRHKQK